MFIVLSLCSETALNSQPQKFPDYPGSHQMEPLLQALRSESHSGRVLRKHIDKASNVVCSPVSAYVHISSFLQLNINNN